MFVYKCFDYFFRQFLLGVVVIYCFSGNTRSSSLPSNFVLRPGGNKEKKNHSEMNLMLQQRDSIQILLTKDMRRVPKTQKIPNNWVRKTYLELFLFFRNI